MLTSKFRPLLRVPPRAVMTFPERSSDWPKTYPSVIKPWIGGVRAFWLDDIQAFQLQDGRQVRVDGIEPLVPDGIGGIPAQNLLGEFWEKGVPHEETLQHVLNNTPTPDLDFYIFDAEIEEATAKDRAIYCFQIPRQYERHTRIAEAYEVYTPGGFRTYLDGWRKAYLGGLAVESQSPWLSTEYEVTLLI